MLLYSSFITYIIKKADRYVGKVASSLHMITGWLSVGILKAPAAGSTLDGRNAAEAHWCHLDPV